MKKPKTEDTQSQSVRTENWRRLVLVFIPLLILFLIGEIIGHLLETYADYVPRRSAAFASANPYIRTALIPDTHYRSGPRDIVVNHHGFRGDPLAMPKPENTFRIFAIGESSTFGWKGVTSHTQSWPRLLQQLLRDTYGHYNIEVINAGVPGYTSVEQRVNYMLRISRLAPDALLIYHGNNDIDWSWRPELETHLIYGRDAVSPPNDSWLNRLMERSYVYMELRYRWFGLISPYANSVKHDLPDPDAIEMLRTNLKELIADARRDGLKIAIATFAHGLEAPGTSAEFTQDEIQLGVPSIGRWFQHLSIQGARRSYPIYNDMIRGLAAEEGIPLNDLAPIIPKTTEYHTDWCHLTIKGHEQVAMAWFRTIEASGWFSENEAE